MTVFVDNMFMQATVNNGPVTHSSRWCHLVADTTAELVAFARLIGLQPRYIQDEGSWGEHFDVTEGKRWQAVRHGATELTLDQMGRYFNCRRTGEPFDPSHVAPYDTGITTNQEA